MTRPHPTRLSDLSQSWKVLIVRMQEINFGRIDGLAFDNGEPVFGPELHVVTEFKPGGNNGPRPERHLPDFELSENISSFVAEVARRGRGRIQALHVKGGMPFKIDFIES